MPLTKNLVKFPSKPALICLFDTFLVYCISKILLSTFFATFYRCQSSNWQTRHVKFVWTLASMSKVLSKVLNWLRYVITRCITLIHWYRPAASLKFYIFFWRAILLSLLVLGLSISSFNFNTIGWLMLFQKKVYLLFLSPCMEALFIWLYIVRRNRSKAVWFWCLCVYFSVSSLLQFVGEVNAFMVGKEWIHDIHDVIFYTESTELARN